MTSVEWVDDAAGPVVRPYAMVRGRTRSEHCLFDLVAFVVSVVGSVETLHRWMEMQPEHQAILRLCLQPRSVTEVAALLSLPIGVVRVLLGDLLEAHAIRVREPSEPTGRPSIQLITEVLQGLREL